MNRKERRKAGKNRPAPASPAVFDQADRAHRAGDLRRAEQYYRAALADDPRHADSLHRLGLIAHQRGDHAGAVPLLRQAIAWESRHAAYHSHLALALGALGKVEEAIASCRTAMALDGTAPDSPNTLGLLLLQEGKADEAVAAFAQSIRCDTGLPEVHNNLGLAQRALGRMDAAEDAYRQALQLAPAFVEAQVNLAALLGETGRLDEAVSAWRGALAIAPGHGEMLCGLALALRAAGDHGGAVRASLEALQAGDTPETRRIFVTCIKDAQLGADSAALKPVIANALQGWGRPEDLALCAADLVLADKQDCETFSDEALVAVLAGDALLLALLRTTPNLDLRLERLLVRARRALLTGAHAPALAAALAQQCFLNEYVFDCADDEWDQVSRLVEQASSDLAAGSAPTAQALLAIATYQPLHRLAGCARLAEFEWDAEVTAVITRQVTEPAQEQGLKAGIPRLTPITDATSRAVQDQYETNPYPRWAAMGAMPAAQSLVDHVRQRFPLAMLRPAARGAEVLVAGCGTGRNAIETAASIQDAQVLAIDLSLSSLAYAVRMSPQGITYAQADLMALEGRSFDLVEASGVLHHMADPFAGWGHLLSLLKPGGFMSLGLYSRAGRRDIIAARQFIAPRGWTGSAADIRAARQALMASRDFPSLLERQDFYTMSACRDLLFHVQEHQLDLDQIGQFVREHDLHVLGFDLEPSVLAAYRRCFPNDPAACDLDQWAAFEADNPDIFAGMYRFWVQA